MIIFPKAFSQNFTQDSTCTSASRGGHSVKPPEKETPLSCAARSRTSQWRGERQQALRKASLSPFCIRNQWSTHGSTEISTSLGNSGVHAPPLPKTLQLKRRNNQRNRIKFLSRFPFYLSRCSLIGSYSIYHLLHLLPKNPEVTKPALCSSAHSSQHTTPTLQFTYPQHNAKTLLAAS